ncbi:hypothetical protein PS914_02433 [Pseudomonas fluorescens]|uniref:Uncharacterized protein n=1 Tax=Pseudomonas fluorescens TaxID=294 RepID=A0A5E7S9Q3_PSEFL|nr:hypothetical protein PS833_00361 [Pseudomonas fluorescens]VVP83412.1 hypothetical protein PS914_02433 [Pseudomonas fluorescens]
MDANDNACLLDNTRCFGIHRRNAARSKLAPTMNSITPYFVTYFVPFGLSSFACNNPHSRRMIE